MEENDNEEWGNKAIEEWIKTVQFGKYDPSFSDEYISSLLEHIKHTAKIRDQQLKSTPEGEIAHIINQEVQKWEISDQDQMNQNIDNMAFSFKKEKDLVKQYQLAKVPDEYAKSLEAFSDAVNAQLKRHNISQEKAAPVQESINELG